MVDRHHQSQLLRCRSGNVQVQYHGAVRVHSLLPLLIRRVVLRAVVALVQLMLKRFSHPSSLSKTGTPILIVCWKLEV